MNAPYTPRKKTISVDFDGVIHLYTSPWVAPDVISDGPVPGAIEFLMDAMTRFHVVISSARNKYDDGVDAMKKFLLHNGMPLYMVQQIEFPKEKPPAHLYIDDRAMCFQGAFPSTMDIEAFKPWNK